MTLSEILRKSCAANNLGTTGSSAVLLARLIKSNKKTPAKSTAPKKTIAKKTSNKPTKKAAACTRRQGFMISGLLLLNSDSEV